MSETNQNVNRQSSRFTGRLLGLIWIKFITFFISLISVGLLIPVAVVMKQKWNAKNTIYSGRRLVFTGRAGGLFGNYIKWLLLSIVTLGFFAFLIPVRIQRWAVANTHFADGHKCGKSEFKGRSFGFYFRYFFAFLMTLVTIGLLLPTAIAFVQKWYNQNKVIDGYQMRFTGRGIHLFGNYIKWMLLSIITLGIYLFWLPIKFRGWIVKNTIFSAKQAHVDGEVVAEEYALETSEDFDEYEDILEFEEVLDFEEEFGLAEEQDVEPPKSSVALKEAAAPKVSAPVSVTPAVSSGVIDKKARGHYGLPIVFGIISLVLMPNVIAFIHGAFLTVLLPLNYVIIFLLTQIFPEGPVYDFIVDLYDSGSGQSFLESQTILGYLDLRYYLFYAGFFIVGFVLSLIAVIKAFKYRGPKKSGFSKAMALIPLILFGVFIASTIVISILF